MNSKKIKYDLKNFYNSQAEKFSSTRKKKWPEFSFILEEIKNYSKNNIKILELGCGDGRLFGFISDNLLEKGIDYVGIDISENLIEIAKTKYKNYSNSKWLVGDMLETITKFNQQTFDFVILVASFQHIFGKIERLKLLNLIYRVLDYGGKIILVNWSFSIRFFKKYRYSLINSTIKSILTFGRWEWNDLFIPWKSDDGIIFKRYYHIFTLKELKFYLQESGFVINKSGYIDRYGNFTHKWTNARNTLVIGNKQVLVD